MAAVEPAARHPARSGRGGGDAGPTQPDELLMGKEGARASEPLPWPSLPRTTHAHTHAQMCTHTHVQAYTHIHTCNM